MIGLMVCIVSLVGCTGSAECSEEDARFISPSLCTSRHEIPASLVSFAQAVRERGGHVVYGRMMDAPEEASPRVDRTTERMGYVLSESLQSALVVVEDSLGEPIDVDALIQVTAPADRFFISDITGAPRCDAPSAWTPAGRDPSACPYDPVHHLLPRINEPYVFFLDQTSEVPYELAWGTPVFETSRVSGDGALDGVSVYLEDLDR